MIYNISMKITEWNLENFYILMDKYKNQDIDTMTNDEWENLSVSTTIKNKHLQKVLDAKRVIEEIDADVYVFTEVGGRESLSNFNKYFLDEKYWYYFKNGNSNRGIEIGFLVNKRLDYKAEVHSNKNILLENGKRFSRNIAELRLSQNDKLKLIILGVHLKSKHSREDDFQGMRQREMELKALRTHISKLEKEYSVPVVIAGDFNCTMEEPELKNFAKGLSEFHKIKKSSIEESCTHVHFSTKRVLNQLDYIFSTKNLKYDLKNSYTYKFRNEYGDVLDLPESIQEKQWNPSDHYPLVLKIKNY